MEDITPLNLEDHPKLFGLRYDQLIVVLVALLIGTELYSWLNPIPFCGQDLRLDITIFIIMIGPVYCLLTLHSSAGQLEQILNFWFASHIFIPGPDPNPVRFLLDEPLPEFSE